MKLSYEQYLDQVLGGWIGKSMGGAIGARFEGYKGWFEIQAAEMFPAKMPPNDDLDLQVLWLRVLEERGADLVADDLAEAWLKDCWSRGLASTRSARARVASSARLPAAHPREVFSPPRGSNRAVS